MNSTTKIKLTIQVCDYRKHRTPKRGFTAMACDSKSHAIILRRAISVELNIGKKITGLKIMTLSREKI